MFTRGGRTDNVFFFDVHADGYSLDDKREPISDNDLPRALSAWKRWQADGECSDWERSAQAFFVPAPEIRGNAYDLSISCYHDPMYEEEEHDLPQVILGRIQELEREIQRDLVELEGLLR